MEALEHNGWIKVHRKIKKWGWYSSPPTFNLFIHLLINANFEESEFMGHKIPAGSVVFGYSAWERKTGHSVNQLRTAVEHLISTSEITLKTTNKFSIISITNWQDYQENHTQNHKRGTNEAQTNHKQTTTSKEEKKRRREELVNENKKKCSHETHEVIEEFSTLIDEAKHYASRIEPEKQRKLLEEYDESMIRNYFLQIADWDSKQSESKKVKNVYLTITKWLSRAGIESNSEFKLKQEKCIRDANKLLAGGENA